MSESDFEFAGMESSDLTEEGNKSLKKRWWQKRKKQPTKNKKSNSPTGFFAKIPGASDRYVAATVLGYVLALLAALWLVYMGECTGADCFVLRIYPPGSSPETFISGVTGLRDSAPWLVPVALFVFLIFWTILGWTLWILSPSALGGKSGIAAIASIILLFAFAGWLSYVTLDKIGNIDGSIAIWVSVPSFLCAIVACVYLGLWAIRERMTNNIARQVSDASQRIDQICGSVADIETSKLITTASVPVMAKFATLRNINTSESTITEATSDINRRSDSGESLRGELTANSSPRDLLVHAIAASNTLNQIVNGPFWDVANAKKFRAEVDWSLKALQGELNLMLDRLSRALSNQLNSVWGDLERLAGGAGTEVIKSNNWVSPDDAAVIAKFRGAGWDSWKQNPR
jgi:hypothetical protein